MIRPKTPSRRPLLRRTPKRLMMNPAGVPAIKTSPTRTEIADPQPGRSRNMAAMAPSAASTQIRPMRPIWPQAFPAFPAGAPNCSLISRLLQLNLDRLAGGLQRLEIELDADRDLLADRLIRYSP